MLVLPTGTGDRRQPRAPAGRSQHEEAEVEHRAGAGWNTSGGVVTLVGENLS